METYPTPGSIEQAAYWSREEILAEKFIALRERNRTGENAQDWDSFSVYLLQGHIPIPCVFASRPRKLPLDEVKSCFLRLWSNAKGSERSKYDRDEWNKLQGHLQDYGIPV